MKLKRVLLMVLAATLLSYPVLGAENYVEKGIVDLTQEQEQASDSFEQIHDEEVALMRKYGKPVHASVGNEEIKLTVEYMLADAYTTRLLIAVEKVDGNPFQSIQDLRLENVDWVAKKDRDLQAKLAALPENAPYVEVLKIMAEENEELGKFIKSDDTVDMEGLMAYIQEAVASEGIVVGTSGGSHGMCHTQENTESKIYFTYHNTTATPAVGEMILNIDGISAQRETNQVVATDLVAYLTRHQKAPLVTKLNSPEDFQLKRLEELQKTNQEEYEMYKEDLESRPKALLDEGGLGLELTVDDTSCVIDNIGFIEGQLHIRLIGEGLKNTSLDAYDQAGEQIYATYNTGSTRTLEDGTEAREAYHIFEIDSISSLKNYSFVVNRRETVEQWEGPWEIPLDMSELPELRVIEVNQMIPYTVEEQAMLKEVKIGKASLSLVIDHIQSELTNDNITMTLHFKDGSSIIEQYSSATERSKEQLTLVYSSKDLVGKEIVSIQIGEQLILIQ